MKKILVITSDCGKTVSWQERETYVADFAKKLAKTLPGSSVDYAIYGDLIFSVLGGTPEIINSKTNTKLEDYDFVHFKNWQYELEDAGVVAAYLDRNGIPFANEEVNTRLNSNKLSQMFALAFEGIPVPDTLYVRASVKNFYKLLNDKLDYPMIVKANDGSRGDSNYLIKNETELVKILEDESDKTFVFQRYVPNKGDYRILFIGSDNAPLVFLRTGDGSSHLNNTSKGGSGEIIDFNTLSSDIRKHATLAVKVLRREISGVDIIINSKTKEHYVLEVNSTPAIATGFATEEKLQAFAHYISTLTEEKEEE